jgi:hypothetical protein
MLYALFAPGGLFWLDSGELLAAVVRWGSPHPTGFPLICALARVATWIPLGEVPSICLPGCPTCCRWWWPVAC